MPSTAIKGKTLQIEEPGDKYSAVHNRNLKKLASSQPAAHRAPQSNTRQRGQTETDGSSKNRLVLYGCRHLQAGPQAHIHQ